MRNVLILALAAFAAWFGYTQYQERSRDPGENSGPKAFESSPLDTSRCDGRTRCAQMTSCEEATYFIRNCPKRRWTETTTECRANSSGAISNRTTAGASLRFLRGGSV